MKPYDKTWKKLIFTSVCIVAGNALLAFLVAAFIIPHDIIVGGTTGIGIVLHKFFPSMDVSLFILVLNLALLLLGLIVLGKKFAVTTVASSFLYPIFLGMFQQMPGVYTMAKEPLMAAIFAGCLLGVAMGLVMRVGSSTGGIDVVTLILHRIFHLPVSVFVYLCDFVVIGWQALFSSSESILLGIIVLVLESIVLEKVMILGKAQIQLYVISEKYEEIRGMLLKDLEAGVTMTMIETGLLAERQKAVLCIIPQRKLYNATSMIHDIDPKAFITITQVREVRGQGFTEARTYLDPK